jgi:uncharacterized lipoprotein YddW (UPF0748 family)
VRRGGGIIFIDGPTKSIKLQEIQAITGMQSRGRYFEETTLMIANGDHPLIPRSPRDTNLATYQALDAQWKAFRKRGVNELIKEVYQQVKSKHPQVVVSVTITSDQEQAAERTLQDWPAWLEGGYVDVVIPRGYVDQAQLLAPVITDWQPVIQNRGRITLGLKVFSNDGKAAVTKTPYQVLAEIEQAHDAGSRGIMLFDLDRMSDEQLVALAAGPFSAPVSPGQN